MCFAEHLQQVVKNRESENGKLEREVTEYRDDMDKMLETFKVRRGILKEQSRHYRFDIQISLEISRSNVYHV